MARDIYVSSLHTLIKPILYEINLEQDVTENMLGFDEVILLSHDDEKVHFMGVRRNDGVFDSVDYMTITAEEFWDAMNGIEYICKGFIDLDSIKAKYLFAGVWEETVVGDALDNAEYEHLAEIVGSLVIEQFKGENKQEKYREVINTIFKEWEHNRDK